MGRGYSFEVLRAKMLYTAGIQKIVPARYGAEPFDAVLPDVMTHSLMNRITISRPRPDVTSSRVLGSDFRKLMAMENGPDTQPGKI